MGHYENMKHVRYLLHVHHDLEFCYLDKKCTMSENLNGIVSTYSWSMPAESSCSLGKRSLKIVVVMTILWLGFFLRISFAMTRPGMSNRWVLMMTMSKLVLFVFLNKRFRHASPPPTISISRPNESKQVWQRYLKSWFDSATRTRIRPGLSM